MRPNYYVKNGVECRTMINAIVQKLPPDEAYSMGNVIKYLWRYRYKNGLEDLEKAKTYLEFLIEDYAKNVSAEMDTCVEELIL